MPENPLTPLGPAPWLRDLVTDKPAEPKLGVPPVVETPVVPAAPVVPVADVTVPTPLADKLTDVVPTITTPAAVPASTTTPTSPLK